MFQEVINDWWYAEKVWGGRIIFEQNAYRFQPIKSFKRAVGGYSWELPYLQKDYDNLEIVACGIMAYYIKCESDKMPKQIFAEYYNDCFESFKNKKRHDIEFFLKSESEIEAVFVETMINEERISIEASNKGLAKYKDYSKNLTEDGLNVLNQVAKTFMCYLHDRLNELQTKTTISAEQTASTTTQSEEIEDNSNFAFDKEALKALFVSGFFDKSYMLEDTSTNSFIVSRYDKFCQRLEIVLSDKHDDLRAFNYNIGAIAYMIYHSPYTKKNYRFKGKGKKGCFANLIKTIFDIVKLEQPGDTSPNKYDEPSKSLIDLFSDILKWEKNK